MISDLKNILVSVYNSLASIVLNTHTNLVGDGFPHCLHATDAPLHLIRV